MEITQITNQEESALDQFKSQVWPEADAEHYGNNQPAFFRDTMTLIAKDNNEIVGYITLIIDSGVAQIEPLMVKTELKGTGVGKQLLKAAEKKAKELGVHKIWLETGADWKAKGFYEHFGYSIRTTLPNHTGGREFVLMDKILM